MLKDSSNMSDEIWNLIDENELYNEEDNKWNKIDSSENIEIDDQIGNRIDETTSIDDDKWNLLDDEIDKTDVVLLRRKINQIERDYYRSGRFVKGDAVKTLKNLFYLQPDDQSYIEYSIAKIFYDQGKYNYSLKFLKRGSNKRIHNEFYLLYALNFIEFREYDLAFDFFKKFLLSVDSKNIDYQIMYALFNYVCNGEKISIDLNNVSYSSDDTILHRKYIGKIAKILETEDYELVLDILKKLIREDKLNKFLYNGYNSLVRQAINRKKGLDEKLYKDHLLSLKHNVTIERFDVVIDSLDYIIKYYPYKVYYVLGVLFNLAANGYQDIALDYLQYYTKTYNHVSKYSEEILAIELMAKNADELDELTEEELNEHKEIIKKAKVYYLDKDYKTAREYYEYGLYRTGLNLYNYYIGKCFYKERENESAGYYLNTYINKGGNKIHKAAALLMMLGIANKSPKDYNYFLSLRNKYDGLIDMNASKYEIKSLNSYKNIVK